MTVAVSPVVPSSSPPPPSRRRRPAPANAATVPPLSLLLLLCLLLPVPRARAAADANAECPASDPPCAAGGDDDVPSDLLDPHLRPVTFEGSTFLAYVPPDVSAYYRDDPGTRKVAVPTFAGLAGKFINLSPERVRLYWQSQPGRSGSYHGDLMPFDASGTATFPSHRWYLSKYDDPTAVLFRFVIEGGRSLYVYDPYSDDAERRGAVHGREPRKLTELSADQRGRYDLQVRNLAFAERYRDFTGRDWLSLYPKRGRPSYRMWGADYFGQKFYVESGETHFAELPPEGKLGKIADGGSDRRLGDDEPRLLQEYRAPSTPTLNLTLTVLSCAPRAYEIRNFLSEVEADHILRMSTGIDLRRSTTGMAGTADADDDDDDTRTSQNAWVYRERSPIVDAIYRRAADLLRIPESLLRRRSPTELPRIRTYQSIAEPLQLVHYAVGQQYTPHHDFMYPSSRDEGQGTRWATLLLYLNEGMGGGETTFPRWTNAETGDPLAVEPEKGKAVLFYSILPDGNMDDLSQHASVPVTEGEKWLMNLWVHDPYS